MQQALDFSRANPIIIAGDYECAVKALSEPLSKVYWHFPRRNRTVDIDAEDVEIFALFDHCPDEDGDVSVAEVQLEVLPAAVNAANGLPSISQPLVDVIPLPEPPVISESMKLAARLNALTSMGGGTDIDDIKVFRDP